MLARLDTLRRFTAPLSQRIRLMVSRGVVKLVNDSLKCQGLQVSLLADELRDDVERFEDYGFTSHPLVGAEVLFLSVGGNRSHGIVARVMDRRYRPKDMGEGDVCLFTVDGERVYLDRANDLAHLGAKTATEFAAKAATANSELDAIRTDIDNLKTALSSWVPIAMDGGAALKAAIAAWAGAALGPSSSVAASKVKVE